jgi:hypothetical protein
MEGRVRRDVLEEALTNGWRYRISCPSKGWAGSVAPRTEPQLGSVLVRRQTGVTAEEAAQVEDGDADLRRERLERA